MIWAIYFQHMSTSPHSYLSLPWFSWGSDISVVCQTDNTPKNSAPSPLTKAAPPPPLFMCPFLPSQLRLCISSFSCCCGKMADRTNLKMIWTRGLRTQSITVVGKAWCWGAWGSCSHGVHGEEMGGNECWWLALPTFKIQSRTIAQWGGITTHIQEASWLFS